MTPFTLVLTTQSSGGEVKRNEVTIRPDERRPSVADWRTYAAAQLAKLEAEAERE